MEEIFYINNINFDQANNCQITEFELNSNASLFKKHFPGMPILPGAVTITIIDISNRNCFEHLSGRFFLKKIIRFSFSKVIIPDKGVKFFSRSCFQFSKNQCVVQVNVTDVFGNIVCRGVLEYEHIGE